MKVTGITTLDHARQAFAQDPLIEPDASIGAIGAVFLLLRRQISFGEYRQVASVMREPLRDLRI